MLETGLGLKPIHFSFQQHSAAYSWPFPDVLRERRNTYSLCWFLDLPVVLVPHLHVYSTYAPCPVTAVTQISKQGPDNNISLTLCHVAGSLIVGSWIMWTEIVIMSSHHLVNSENNYLTTWEDSYSIVVSFPDGQLILEHENNDPEIFRTAAHQIHSTFFTSRTWHRHDSFSIRARYQTTV